jgi:hypothetical protein
MAEFHISQQKIREVTALSVYDNHVITTHYPVGGRHEARCSCDWISPDAYRDVHDARQAGQRHQEDQLTRELAELGIGDGEAANHG